MKVTPLRRVATSDPLAEPEAGRRCGNGLLLRCWRALVYIHRLNYSRHLAWVKAQH